MNNDHAKDSFIEESKAVEVPSAFEQQVSSPSKPRLSYKCNIDFGHEIFNDTCFRVPGSLEMIYEH